MKKKQPKQLLITARSGSRSTRFWESLERYVYGRSGQVPWVSVGVGLTGLVIVASVAGGYYNSPTLGASRLEIIKVASERGDYELAQQLYAEQQASDISHDVLGVESELEESVYPERRIQREIGEWEEKLTKYPTHRDILLTLSSLYKEIGNEKMANTRDEQARILDPNGEMIREIGEQLTGN